MKRKLLSKSIYSDLNSYGISFEESSKDFNNYFVIQDNSVNDALNEYIKNYFENFFLLNKTEETIEYNITDNGVLNFYRSEKLDANYWIATNDLGRWICLTDQDYHQLTNADIESFPSELTKLLYSNFFIIDNHNFESYITLLEEMYSYLNSGPGLHIIVVTRRCNLNCIYCQVHAGMESESNMTIETADNVIINILRSNSKFITVEFQGGEPSLNFDVVEYIVGEIKRMNTEKVIDFSFISNFSDSFDDRIAKFIIENDIYLSVSLDGPEDIHNFNRDPRFNISFQKTIENIKLFKNLDKENKSRFNAMPVITKISLPYCREIIDLYIKLGFTQVFLKFLTPLGKAQEAPNYDYSAEEFLESWKDAIEYIIELRKNGKKINEYFLEIILRKIFGLPSDYVDLRTPCGASYGQVAYYSDGSIYACDEGRMMGDDSFKISDKNSDIYRALSSRKAKLISFYSINELYYCDNCVFKPYCGVCPAIHHSLNQSYFVEILQTKRCKIHKEMFRYVFGKYINDAEYNSAFAEMVDEMILNEIQ